MHMTQSSLDSRGSDQRSYLPQGHTASKAKPKPKEKLCGDPALGSKEQVQHLMLLQHTPHFPVLTASEPAHDKALAGFMPLSCHALGLA